MAFPIKTQLSFFVDNCTRQYGVALPEDISKLERIVELMKQGKNINDDFTYDYTPNEVITMNVDLLDEYNDKLIEAVATIDDIAGSNPHVKGALDDLREVYDFLYIQTNV